MRFSKKRLDTTMLNLRDELSLAMKTLRAGLVTGQAPHQSYRVDTGQAIVELIVALSALTIGLLGLLSLLTSSIRANRQVSDRNIATYLAAEAIEQTKNLIDANILQSASWSCPFSAINLGGNFIIPMEGFNVPPQGGYTCPGEYMEREDDPSMWLVYYHTTGHFYTNSLQSFIGNSLMTVSKFNRHISIELPSDASQPLDRLRVNAIVTWRDPGATDDSVVNLEDHFLNWRKTP